MQTNEDKGFITYFWKFFKKIEKVKLKINLIQVLFLPIFWDSDFTWLGHEIKFNSK